MSVARYEWRVTIVDRLRRFWRNSRKAGISGAALLAPVLLVLALLAQATPTTAQTAPDRFETDIVPILEDHCHACHANGLNKGNVNLSEFPRTPHDPAHRDLWLRVLKNVRAGIMPPADKTRLTAEERQKLEAWIKAEAFGIHATRLDPGPTTLRRLNRVEYANTIRDLMGVEFRTDEEFPPDDTGYGFDTIAEVLSVSPLLLEKYLQAARSIVSNAIPTVAREVAHTELARRAWRNPEGKHAEPRTSFYKALNASAAWNVEQAGDHKVVVTLNIRGGFDYDPGRCELTLSLDDTEFAHETLTWASFKKLTIETTRPLQPGEHTIRMAVSPLSNVEEKKHELDLSVESVGIEGPLDEAHWVRPANYDRFFSRGDAPADEAGRRAYARAILRTYARRAFRRPVEDSTLDRLCEIAVAGWSEPGQTFEAGVARAFVAILASPRFLFRTAVTDPTAAPGDPFPQVDEWTLAARLSYFLWSSMPDDELLNLAERGELRSKLADQVKRMLSDHRSHALVENFVGQWLQTRDIEGVSINGPAVLRRDRVPGQPQPQRRGPPFDFDRDLRLAMRRETEMLFEHIVRDDRSVLDLINANYTFLNERLAKHYGIEGVQGNEMRKVELPADSPRGGVLTHGAFLAVTSNPTRTSPVKRGLYVLDNILGTPAPPPPADVPLLEEAEKAVEGHDPTLREALELHRSKPLCSACHARMDPIGLALENFNALGMWRDKERGQPIDPAGKLLTGESFSGIAELKKILAESHRLDFERCLTDKLLTYAIGRGLDYYDVDTVDRIVDRLDLEAGRFSALLAGVIESAPFQRRRGPSVPATNPATTSSPEARKAQP